MMKACIPSAWVPLAATADGAPAAPAGKVVVAGQTLKRPYLAGEREPSSRTPWPESPNGPY